MKKTLLTLIAFFMTSGSFAFFCPTNFKQIDIGDTIDKVTQTCGKPNATKESKSPIVDENVPQEWTYYVNVSSNNFIGNMQNQGSIKMTVSFDKDGKAINISVNGVGMGNAGMCSSTIQVGSSRDQVKSACGDPAFINKQAPSATATATTPGENTTTIYEYQSNPPVKLIFNNGILTEKQ